MAKSGYAGQKLQAGVGAYLLLTFLSVIWGLAFVAIREADFYLSPTSLLLLRWLIASAAFALLLPFAKWKARFERKDVPRLLVFAILSVALYGLFLNTAETTIPAGLAGLLVSLGPVFMVVLSVLTLNEKVGRGLVYALALAVIGTFLLSAGDLNAKGASLAGVAEAIVAALIYAGSTVLSKPLVEKYGALPITISGSMCGTVFVLPFASAEFFRQVSALTFDGWFSVVFLSIFTTVMGYTIFYSLVGRGALSRLSVQLYLVPLVGVAGGILLLSEQLTIFVVLGGAATLTAVGLVRRSSA